MPRLSSPDYVDRHYLLKKIWSEANWCLACLSPADQWLLHRYYRPSETLYPAELLDHRTAMDIAEPSLGSRTGKLYARVICEYEEHKQRTEQAAAVAGSAQPPAPQPRRKGVRRIAQADRQLSIRAVVRPQPDVQKLAKALIALAMQLAEEKAKATNGEPRPRIDARARRKPPAA